MKMPGIPAIAEGAPAIRSPSEGQPPQGAERRPAKTIRTVVSSTVVSTLRATPQPDGEPMDETVDAVASVLLLEIIGESFPAGGGAGGGKDDADSACGAGRRRSAPDETIAGSSDRAHHLSLKFAHVAFELRQAPHAGTPPIAPRRPSSRAECQRRCGTGGFCDPASDLGCGGEYCGNRYEF